MRTHHRILSALLLLSALAPSTLAQTYTPKQIRIDAPAGVDTAEALRIAALPSGVPLTKQEIETGLQRVVDTGLFSDIAYTVNSDALVIKLTPSASSQLQPAHFSNFVWWQPAELETLVESSVPAYHGKLPLAGTLTDQVDAALVSLLHTKGMDAEVSARETGSTADSVTLSITRPSILIDEVHLQSPLPSLSRQLQTLELRLHGQEFDLAESTRTLQESVNDIYRDAGYLDVSTTAPIYSAPHKDLDAYAVNLTASIQSGDIYRISSIKLPTVPSISPSDLDHAANLQVGSPASAAALRLATAELTKTCTDAGYLDATAKVETSKDIPAHTIAYAFTITPGELYHFASVDTSALTPQQQQSIAHNFQPDPNAIFNQQLTSALANALAQLRLSHLPSFLRRTYPANHTVVVVLKPFSAPTPP
jgi:outer membrane protein assembly factor BamA